MAASGRIPAGSAAAAAPAVGKAAPSAGGPAPGRGPASAGAGGSAPTPAPGAAPVAGCTAAGPTIVIGSVGSYSGIMGSIVAGGMKAVQGKAAPAAKTTKIKRKAASG